MFYTSNFSSPLQSKLLIASGNTIQSVRYNSGNTETETNDVKFMNQWLQEIHYVHTSLREKELYYRLTDSEIYEIQDLLYCKEYVVQPMKLVSKFYKEIYNEKDLCEKEGKVYIFPHVNTDHYILRRFPVDILVDSLPLAYHSTRCTDYTYDDSQSPHYIKSTPSDVVVISAFIIVLIKSLMESSFFKKSCYNNYQSNETYLKFMNSLLRMKDVDEVLYIHAENAKYRYSRSRVITKLAPFVNNEKYLISIIRSIVNCPIHDEVGVSDGFTYYWI